VDPPIVPYVAMWFHKKSSYVRIVNKINDLFLFKSIRIIYFLGLLITTQASCQQHKKGSIPQAIGHVSDFENVFTISQRNYIDSMIRTYERKQPYKLQLSQSIRQ